MSPLVVLLLLGQTGGKPVSQSTKLAPPVRIEAAGKPIDAAEIGHAAPFVGDFDGDGVNDLLVGQFADGLLWIYRNEGSNSSPRLAAGVKFKDGLPEGQVPTG